MKIDKDQIISMLRERGEDHKADQAQEQLPADVDTEEHKGLLDGLGLDPAELLGKLGGGGLGGMLGH